MKLPVVAVCGPTASGKTSLAVELAKRFDGEVVSADSMQIYKGMDVGTAKPTLDEMQGIPHHMLDIVEPDCNFSVSDYCYMAHDIINDIIKRGKMPILAGGTGLYIDSLLNDIDFNAGISDAGVRDRFAGLEPHELYRMLQEQDSEAAESIHMNNVKRVIRALEHIAVTGEKFSDYKKRAASIDSRYNPLMLFINWDREELYKRINCRVDLMFEEGIEKEARELYNKRYDRNLTSMCAIGYKELFDYFDGLCSLEDAYKKIKQNSRRYAKRQLTWFRKNEQLHRLDAGDNLLNEAVKIVKIWVEERYHHEKIHL